MHSIGVHRSAMCSDILSPGSLKGDVPASKKSYLTTKAVERYVAELEEEGCLEESEFSSFCAHVFFLL